MSKEMEDLRDQYKRAMMYDIEPVLVRARYDYRMTKWSRPDQQEFKQMFEFSPGSSPNCSEVRPDVQE